MYILGEPEREKRRLERRMWLYLGLMDAGNLTRELRWPVWYRARHTRRLAITVWVETSFVFFLSHGSVYVVGG